MGYMNLKTPVLEKLFKNFKWSRNNTVEMFEKAERNGILDYKAPSSKFTTFLVFNVKLKSIW